MDYKKWIIYKVNFKFINFNNYKPKKQYISLIDTSIMLKITMNLIVYFKKMGCMILKTGKLKIQLYGKAYKIKK